MKTLNADMMKWLNKNRALRIIREQPCSRVNLAKKLGLTRSAISVICKELKDQNLIYDGTLSKSEGGRPAVEVCLNGEYGVFAGVFITRSVCFVGLCDFAGEVLAQEQMAVNVDNAKQTLQEVVDKIKLFISEYKNPKLLGIGITAPGPLDKDKGIIGEVVNFNGWNNLNIVDAFNNQFECSVYLDNVSNALAKAEYLKNPKCQNKYLELVIDSGFGSAVLLNKEEIEILECELGHTTVDMHGKKCECGNVGCAELYVNQTTFFGSRKQRVDFYSALSSVIVSAINTFNVRQVVFSGVVVNDFDDFLQNLLGYLQSKTQNPPDLLASTLENSKIFTACNLAIDKYKV